MNRLRSVLLGLFLLVLCLTFASCGIFGAVGDTMAQWYDDSVSYFNSYYNAKRTFNEAEEGLLATELAARGKTQPNQRSIALPATVRDKFNLVIDKCSSILSFYPHSTLVDDALFLIGKSYYYLQDYLKAERKFSELISQYPSSSLVIESHLWYARTLEKQRKNEDAKKTALQVAETAIEQHELVVACGAYELLGRISENDHASPEAIDWYTKALENSQDDFTTYNLNTKLGDLYFAQNNYDKANAAYLKTYDQATDVYLNYYSRIQAARGYEALKRYDTALYLTSEMLGNIRFIDFYPIIRLEYANILLESGRTPEALDEFRGIDTTYRGTETAANASFTLAQYYETTKGAYDTAKIYYGKASSVVNAPIAPQAKRRENGLSRVLQLKHQFMIHDSLLALSDSVRRFPGKFLVVDKDTATVDSLSHGIDTTAIQKKQPRLAFKPLNPDSMKSVRAVVAYDLGEAFYTELEISDSALVWFQRCLDWKVDSTRAPRAMFILAELAKTTKTRTDSETTALYRNIVATYPFSLYADEARKILGMPVVIRKVELTEHKQYAVAESLFWAGNYYLAIDRFKAIVDSDESSAIAAKSEYAIGWVYEHYLSKPDSALLYYKVLIDKYKTSSYALAVKNRIGEIPKNEKKEPEPAKKPQPGTPIPRDKKVDEDDETPKALPQPKNSKPDTAKVKTIEK